MDGTIIDMEDLNFQSCAKVAEQYLSFDLDNDLYQKYFSGSRSVDGFDRLLKHIGNKELDPNMLSDEFRVHKREALTNRPDEALIPISGAFDFLKQLSAKGKKLGLVTSTQREFTDMIIEHFKLTELFGIVVTGDDVRASKPDPEGFLLAIEKLGSTIFETVIFEDSKSGLEAAISTGAYCVGILTVGKNDDYVGMADVVVEDYSVMGFI